MPTLRNAKRLFKFGSPKTAKDNGSATGTSASRSSTNGSPAPSSRSNSAVCSTVDLSWIDTSSTNQPAGTRTHRTDHSIGTNDDAAPEAPSISDCESTAAAPAEVTGQSALTTPPIASSSVPKLARKPHAVWADEQYAALLTRLDTAQASLPSGGGLGHPVLWCASELRTSVMWDVNAKMREFEALEEASEGLKTEFEDCLNNCFIRFSAGLVEYARR